MNKRELHLKKMRLDECLVSRGLVESRNKAKGLIENGEVTVNGEIVKKSAKQITETDALAVLGKAKYVSRAGEKLDGFLKHLALNIHGTHCLDIGASTGGFTDCLLQHGAEHVTCIDVGHGQLHPKLIKDTRVSNFEGVNAKELSEVKLPYPTYDIVVMDLSFISIKKVLETAWPFLKDQGTLIILIKPQFEAGKEIMKATKGVLRDIKIIETIVDDIKNFITKSLPNVRILKTEKSSILGSEGNIEYLLALSKIKRIE